MYLFSFFSSLSVPDATEQGFHNACRRAASSDLNLFCFPLIYPVYPQVALGPVYIEVAFRFAAGAPLHATRANPSLAGYPFFKCLRSKTQPRLGGLNKRPKATRISNSGSLDTSVLPSYM